MAEDKMFQEAVAAVRQGQTRRARDLLTRLLRADSANPDYWLWMSAVVDTSKERIYCLQTVLRLDPDNQSARRGLVLNGALRLEEGEVEPRPPQPREWQVTALEEPPSGMAVLWRNPLVRLAGLVVVILVVAGLILLGVMGGRGRRAAVAVQPSHTPGPPPTFTSTPTSISSNRATSPTRTPVITGLAPLWMQLEATYTPTPLYVDTPHPISEAYRVAQRAYLRGDQEAALRFFRDASQVDANAPDLQYYVGELERLQGDNEAALRAYQRAIELDPAFAPAYLGRALTQLALDPQADVGADLDLAIERDANFGEAYLERAAYRLRQGEMEAAFEDLAVAAELLPDSPWLYIYRARANLVAGEVTAALADAQEAHHRDQTALPAYLVLGQAAVLSGDFPAAVDALQTYTLYAEDDLAGWLALGQAYAGFTSLEQVYYDFPLHPANPDFEAAGEALDKVLAQDDEHLEGLIFQGLLYLAQDEGQPAVNVFFQARRLAPDSFLISLGLARALLAADRVDDAFAQLSGLPQLAETDAQKDILTYWRALASEERGLIRQALDDWLVLAELPPEELPAAWQVTIAQKINALATPTATPSQTASPVPSITPTATRTVRPSATPRRTTSPPSASTVTPTATP